MASCGEGDMKVNIDRHTLEITELKNCIAGQQKQIDRLREGIGKLIRDIEALQIGFRFVMPTSLSRLKELLEETE